MIDFKPIDEFTFDDCVNSLERCKSDGISPDEELLRQYDLLLEQLKMRKNETIRQLRLLMD